MLLDRNLRALSLDVEDNEAQDRLQIIIFDLEPGP